MYVALAIIGSIAILMIAYYGPRYYHWEKRPWKKIEDIGWPRAVDREPKGCLWTPVAALIIVIATTAYLHLKH